MMNKQLLSKLVLAALALCAAFLILVGASAPRAGAAQTGANAYDMIPAHSPFNAAVADSDPPPPDSSNAATEDLTLKGNVGSGNDLYSKRCSDCHGDDAMGDKGPKLVGNVILTNDDHFWSTVLDGRKKMPSFKMKLKSQDIADVRAYLLTLQPTE
jgi:mono/diheme cytochrome c family protein